MTASSDAVFGFIADQSHLVKLRRFFRRSSREEIEDLVQRTVLSALQSRTRYRGEARPQDFVLGVARYTLFERHRERRRESLLEPFTDSHEHDLSTTSDAFLEHVASALERAVTNLSPSLQMVVRLFYWEQRTQSEIATILRLPPGTVASRLRRARELLREALSEEPQDKAR